MTEATSKTAYSAFETPKFEMPKFDIPSFDMPRFEVPAAFREAAEKGVAQAKENWEKMKSATEEVTDVLEDSYATAARGNADYGLKVIETARANTNAAFDFASAVMAAKSFSEVVELSASHARKQFEAGTTQARELTALAQRVATDTVEPLKTGMTSAFKKAN